MGLDGVEIVMRTEETFGIEIPNEVAARLLTPAALVDYVAANVPLKATEECLSQQTFYRLRRGFRSQLKALSATLELDTPLKEILHKVNGHRSGQQSALKSANPNGQSRFVGRAC